MARTATAFFFFCVLITMGAAPAGAAGPGEVIVEVTSIGASMAPASGAEAAEVGQEVAEVTDVDPRLARYAKKLESLFAYRRYSFLGRANSKTGFGESCRFQLPERFVLKVEPERFEPEGGGRVEMLVTLVRDVPRQTRGPVGDARSDEEIVLRTRIRLESGGTVLLGGPPLADGVLILALSVRRP